MPEQREQYVIVGDDSLNQQINFVLNRISDRLDRMEGLRGNPQFFSSTLEWPSDTIEGVLFAESTQDRASFSMTPTLTDITLSGDLSVGDDLSVTGDITIGAGGKFILTDLSDGYIPYHVSDTAGLDDSPFWTNGSIVGIGTTAPKGANVKLHVADGTNADTNWLGNVPFVIESSNNCYLNLRSPNSSISGVVFSDPDTTWEGLIEYQHSTARLNFYAGRDTANYLMFLSGNLKLISNEGAVAAPSKARIIFPDSYDNAGFHTANKITTYGDGSTWTGGIGVSSSTQNYYVGSGQHRFWINHAQQGSVQGSNRLDIGTNIIFNETGDDCDIRMEGNTATDLFYLDGGDDSIYLGGKGAGNYSKFEKDGDLKFVGTAGLQFGSFYGNEIGWQQASAAQNTWYDISDADISDGQLHGVTHDGSGQLTAVVAGMYLINYAISYEVSLPSKHIQVTLSINGTETNDGMSHGVTGAASDQISSGGTAILDLAANDTVNLSIRTTDAGTPDIDIDHVNLTMVQIGGT